MSRVFCFVFILRIRLPPRSTLTGTLFHYTTLFRALDDQVHRLAQSLRDGADLARIRGPVMSVDAITPADCLMQAPLAVDQGYRHTVNFRLYPDVLSTVQPGPHGVGILQFSQAGMVNGGEPLSTRRAQGTTGGRGV